MNMYSLLDGKNGQLSLQEIENSFGGNICRCTGYRPILDAFKSLAVDADETLKGLCGDIEDLKICRKTGETCAGSCPSREMINKTSISLKFRDLKEWHKVFNLHDLYEKMLTAGHREYMLVCGNTAHGVYRRPNSIEIFIDVTSVEELRSFAIGDTLTIGGNVTLTETMSILERASNTVPGFEYCRAIMSHIDLIANVPVRNVGSLAGNLSIKHQHKEFPSDIYICLESVGAHLTIGDSSGNVITVTIYDFLTIDMNQRVILNIVLPQISTGKFQFRSYKITPRAQNAHAFVNAGFLVEFNDAKNKVISARLCYGGIDPNFTHAFQTENLLIGKDLYTNETLQLALKSLKREINPDWILPDTSDDFRRNLAVSLFYKFVLSTAQQDKVNRKYRSGAIVAERPISSGKQTFDTYQDKWPLTEPITKVEALVQCSGEAVYTNDFSYFPGELWAAFVPGTKVHARIAQIDATEALKIPGVHAFLSAKDIPGVNSFVRPPLFLIVENEEIFCADRIKFYNQPVGMLVAESFALVNYAVDFVKIIYDVGESDEKVLPTLADILESNAVNRLTSGTYKSEKSFKTQEAKDDGTGKPIPPGLCCSKVGKNYSVRGRIELGPQYHFTMEPQSCVCVPIEDGLDVYASTQWIDLTQVTIAEALKIPENSINLVVRRLGGGYGSKISRATQIACATALAAYKLNRPVRFVMTIESNMDVVGKRFGCIGDYSVDCDGRGKIQRLQNNVVEDFGCSSNESPEIFVIEMIKNCYINTAFTQKYEMAKTDAPSSTWCRAPGTLEAMAMIENIMEHISRQTGVDPDEVRLANIDDKNPMKKILRDFIRSVGKLNRFRFLNFNFILYLYLIL